MTTTPLTVTFDHEMSADLSKRLADVFRTGVVGDVFTDDLFLDGHPPYWRFQLQGIDAFASWLRGYVVPGSQVTVVRTVPTAAGFVTEIIIEHDSDDGRITGRELMLCELRGGRIAELTVFCSGEWDADLRGRHAAEAPMIRP